MKKVKEFRKRAAECRESANVAGMPELRAHYEQLALVWDKLAEERLTFFVQAHGEDRKGRRLELEVQE